MSPTISVFRKQPVRFFFWITAVIRQFVDKHKNLRDIPFVTRSVYAFDNLLFWHGRSGRRRDI